MNTRFSLRTLSRMAAGLFAAGFLFAIVSCDTIPQPDSTPTPAPIEPTKPQPTDLMPSPVIAAPGTRSAESLFNFFMANNPAADADKVWRLALYYVSEAVAEGINSDVAFVQMCLETGFLTFGNLVTEDMNNFCGLGAIDAAHPGNRFETEQLGVRAHVQHLHAYGTTVPLNNECIDPRYDYVTRGKAPTVSGLVGTWATDPQYAQKLISLLERLAAY